MTIVPYTMHEAGHIPGLDGYFAAGQTVFVDVDALEVVRIEQPESAAAKDVPIEAPAEIEPQNTSNQQQVVSPATAEINGG